MLCNNDLYNLSVLCGLSIRFLYDRDNFLVSSTGDGTAA